MGQRSVAVEEVVERVTVASLDDRNCMLEGDINCGLVAPSLDHVSC